MVWKILEILVLILIFLVSSDLVRYILDFNLSKKNLKAAQAPGADLQGISEWIIGGLCLISLFLLRILFKRSIPSEMKSSDELLTKNSDILLKKSNNLSKKSDLSRRKSDVSKKSGVICQQSDQEIKRRYMSSSEIELHEPSRRSEEATEISNSMSQLTFNGFADESLADVPSQLNPGQLQVLLEELKFTVDDKFEEIDSWINSYEHGTKLWSKRLERVETELSYIRHQIFILMSCSAKQCSSLCIGDAPETKQHTEALKELSTILAQVKKQYNENELKEKAVETTDILIQRPEESETKIKNYSDNCLEELKRIDEELNHNIFNDFVTKQESHVISSKDPIGTNPFELKLDSEHINDEEHQVMFSKNSENYTIENLHSPKYSKAAGLSKKENAYSNKDKYAKESEMHIKETVDGNIDKCMKNENSYTNINYLKDDFTNEYSNIDNYSILTEDIYTKSHNAFDNSNLTIIRNLDSFNEKEIKVHSIPKKVNEKGDSSDYIVENQRNYFSLNSFIGDQSQVSTNLFDTGIAELKESNMVVEKDVDESEGRSRSASPKRSVRFAQSRDISPSKAPTWVSVTRDSSPVKLNDKAPPITVSDSKVVNETAGNKTVKNRRELSYPGSEKRVSRRTILERELTYLERSVSPSPTRNRNLKNVRSKVGDYIKGYKKRIYEKNTN